MLLVASAPSVSAQVTQCLAAAQQAVQDGGEHIFQEAASTAAACSDEPPTPVDIQACEDAIRAGLVTYLATNDLAAAINIVANGCAGVTPCTRGLCELLDPGELCDGGTIGIEPTCITPPEPCEGLTVGFKPTCIDVEDYCPFSSISLEPLAACGVEVPVPSAEPCPDPQLGYVISGRDDACVTVSDYCPNPIFVADPLAICGLPIPVNPGSIGNPTDLVPGAGTSGEQCEGLVCGTVSGGYQIIPAENCYPPGTEVPDDVQCMHFFGSALMHSPAGGGLDGGIGHVGLSCKTFGYEGTVAGSPFACGSSGTARVPHVVGEGFCYTPSIVVESPLSTPFEVKGEPFGNDCE